MAKTTVKTKYSTRDFEKISWRDNYIHSLCFDSEKFEIIFDIDYIHDWISGDDENYKFLLSPATLTFHNASNLKIDIDWKECSLDLCIDSIERSAPRKTANAKLSEYDWLINIGWPGGAISFCATGFTQISRSAPIVFDEQKIPRAKRAF